MVEPASYFSSYVSVPELPHVFQRPVFTPLDYTYQYLTWEICVFMNIYVIEKSTK